MSEVLAQTENGTVAGREIDGVLRFTGIPYAAPPTGENRFRAPQPAKPWAGTRDATEFGKSSIQIVRPGRGGDIGEMSEDCLVLNVWTRETSGKRPVIVWMHGGGFGQGTAFNATYDGVPLARDEDVVVVSMNHRLGLLAYLHLEDIAGEEFAGSGAAGMLDLVAALEWVQRNIESFGGDPDNVLIHGHSGGGGKVGTLLSMPTARGLFHRAVIHGGPPFGYRTREAATVNAAEALQRLGIDPSRASEIRSVSAERMLQLQIEMGAGPVPGVNGMRFAPVLGTEVIPARPEEALASGMSADVALMAGTSLDEARYMLFANPQLAEPGADIAVDDLIERVSASIDEPSLGGELVRRYRELMPEASNLEVMFDLFSDQFLVRTRGILAAKSVGGGLPSYSYLNDTNQASVYRAFHGASMPYFFNTVAQTASRLPIEASPENLAIAANVSHALAEFARTGRPVITIDGKEQPWPEFTPGDTRQLVFGDPGVRTQADAVAERYAAWDGIPASSATDPWARLFA